MPYAALPQSPPRRCHHAAHALPLLLASLLTACGGGGGGSESVAPTPPVTVTPPVTPATAPLLLSSSNVQTAPVVALVYGVTPLAVAQMVVDWSARFGAGTSASISRSCGNGGLQKAAFVDTDANGRLGSGDKLSITYVNCQVKELDGIIEGTMNVTFTAPAANQQLAGSISFAPGFGDHTETPRQDIGGSVRFDYNSGALSRQLHVYSDTQAMTMIFSDGKTSTTDTLTALDVLQELRLDTARTATRINLHLASGLLGGSLDISTPTPLASWFDTYADAGELLLSGAGGSKASLRVNPSNRNQFDFLLGNSAVGAPDSLDVGILWSSGNWLPNNSAHLAYYDIKPAQPNDFKLLVAPDTSKVAPSASLSWAYSRPLSTSAFTDARFVDLSNNTNTVDARISYNGAVVTVTPVSQLKAGATYSLRINTNTFAPVRDINGNTLPPPVVSVYVDQSIRAFISTDGTPPLLLGPTGTLTLSAAGSSANGSPVSSTRWRQVSGPALAMDKPNATRVTLSSASPSRGIAVVALDVTNAAGETDSQQITVDVLSDVAQAMVYSSRSGTGDFKLDSSARTVRDPITYYGNNTLQLLSPTSLNTFLIGLPGNLTWQTGLALSYGAGNTSGTTGRANLNCSGVQSGSFQVLDFALDGNGKLARAAIDYDDICEGVLTQTSIRYRSDLPVRK